MSDNPNTNCLAGFACPKCGHTDNFLICATVMIDMHDDGSEGVEGDIEWEATSTCVCGNKDCEYTDDVKVFCPSNYGDGDE